MLRRIAMTTLASAGCAILMASAQAQISGVGTVGTSVGAVGTGVPLLSGGMHPFLPAGFSRGIAANFSGFGANLVGVSPVSNIGTALPLNSFSNGTVVPVTTLANGNVLLSNGAVVPMNNFTAGSVFPVQNLANGSVLLSNGAVVPMSTISNGTVVPVTSFANGTVLLSNGAVVPASALTTPASNFAFGSVVPMNNLFATGNNAFTTGVLPTNVFGTNPPPISSGTATIFNNTAGTTGFRTVVRATRNGLVRTTVPVTSGTTMMGTTGMAPTTTTVTTPPNVFGVFPPPIRSGFATIF